MAEAKSTSVERWLPIPGYEGLYEASDRGRVRGVDRIDARGRRWKGKVLSSATVSTYDMVGLWKDGKQKSMKVHTAVLTRICWSTPGWHGGVPR